MKKLFILCLCILFASFANAQMISNVGVSGYFNTNMPPRIYYNCIDSGLTVNIKMLNTQNGNTLDLGNFAQNQGYYNGFYHGEHVLQPITQYPANTTFPAQIKFIVTDVASMQSDSSQLVTYTNIPSEFELQTANGGIYNLGYSEEAWVWGMYLPTNDFLLEIAPWGTTNYTNLGTFTFGPGWGNIPLNQPGDYKVRVTSAFGNGTYSDSSDAPLHVLPPGTNFINILRPSGGEVYNGGQLDTLIYQATGGADWYVYFIDESDSVVSGTEAFNTDYPSFIGITNKRYLTIPNIECDSCRMVVSGGGLSDTSATFAIRGRGVSGRVYFDNNNNAVFDTGDAPVPYPHISVNSFGIYHSKADGRYSFYPYYNGDYIFNINIPFECLHITSPVSEVITMTDSTGSLTGHDYRVIPTTTNGYNLSIHNVTTECGVAHSNQRMVVVGNNGGVASPEGTFTFTYDPDKEHIDNIGYSTGYYYQYQQPISQTANSATFAVPPLGPCTTIEIALFTQATAPDNYLLTEYTTLNGYPQNGNIEKLKDTSHVVVHSGYDPNNKLVDRDTIYTTELPVVEPLYYTIQFQNTGSATTYNVRVIDTLAETLDPSTIKVLSASHMFDLYMRADNVVEWKFPNIDLPDSTIDEPKSHGYVLFSIMPKNTLTTGDEINNFADIYFDYNEPVRTPTAITRVLQPTGISAQKVDEFSLYPNPATGFVQVNLKEKANGKVAVKLYSTDGKMLQTSSHILQNSTLLMQDISSLINGVYYIGINVNGKETVKKLVVIH